MMRKFLVSAGIVLAVLSMASPAFADGVINWAPKLRGSDNLPCESGGHWVLAPAFGVTSATLTVDGVTYTMTQNGQGSWSADSTGAISATTEAYVTFTGEGSAKNHLQLSHCTEGASESPTPTPTPTETDTPTPTVPPTLIPPTRGGSKPPEVEAKTPAKNRPSPLAETGGNATIPGAIAVGLLLAGLTATAFAMRKRSA